MKSGIRTELETRLFFNDWQVPYGGLIQPPCRGSTKFQELRSFNALVSAWYVVSHVVSQVGGVWKEVFCR